MTGEEYLARQAALLRDARKKLASLRVDLIAMRAEMAAARVSLLAVRWPYRPGRRRNEGDEMRKLERLLAIVSPETP
jgi:hypothetical protein